MKKIPTPVLDKIARRLGHPNFEDMTRHHLNPLHIYAKLIDLGIDKKEAREFAEFYEKLYYKRMYGKPKETKVEPSLLYTRTIPIHIVSFIYVIIMTVITFVFKHNIPSWLDYLIVYLSYATFVIITARLIKGFSTPILEFIALMYPWFSIPNFYELLRNYIHAIFPHLFDPLIHQFELGIFGVHPTVYLQRFVSPLLTEIMAFGYFSYYLIFIFPPFILYFFRRKGIAPLIFAMTLAYYFCFIIFVLLPCAGPRFTLADKYTVPLTGYFFPPIQARMMEKFALEGAAFPSSHVAMVVASSFIVKRYMPWLFKIIFPLSIMVALGAVYGRYHYVTDVVAGGIVGIVSALITYKVYQEKI
ncbi:MAG: phosphatase PAP2 family protein [Candidatus Desulfofervidaceae bacterium]|nr:phosphatase PAP2 family protein [Candidatus Desulfofervidaceae bacterium]